MRISYKTITLLIYLIFVLIFYFVFIGKDYYNNDSYTFDADSYTYNNISNIQDDRTIVLISLNQNLLGPIGILYILNNNNFLVLLFNITIFIWSLISLSKILNSKQAFFFNLLIFLNPLTLSSLLTINKEIFTFCSVINYILYAFKKERKYLIISAFFAFISRWQMFAVLTIIYLFHRINKTYKIKKTTLLLLLILLINIIYPIFLKNIFGSIYTSGTFDTQSENFGGILLIFNWLQDHYLFVISLIPKILANYFGNFISIKNIFLLKTYTNFDMYNYIFLPIHQFLFFLIFLFILKKKKFQLNNNIILFAIIYSILFSISSFIQYRYFYPLFIIYSYVLISKNTLHEG